MATAPGTERKNYDDSIDVAKTWQMSIDVHKKQKAGVFFSILQYVRESADDESVEELTAELVNDPEPTLVFQGITWETKEGS